MKKLNFNSLFFYINILFAGCNTFHLEDPKKLDINNVFSFETDTQTLTADGSNIGIGTITLKNVDLKKTIRISFPNGKIKLNNAEGSEVTFTGKTINQEFTFSTDDYNNGKSNLVVDIDGYSRNKIITIYPSYPDDLLFDNPNYTKNVIFINETTTSNFVYNLDYCLTKKGNVSISKNINYQLKVYSNDSDKKIIKEIFNTTTISGSKLCNQIILNLPSNSTVGIGYSLVVNNSNPIKDSFSISGNSIKK
ncbi:MAG: hypothetical protein SFY32_06855 [Bacteroidota bacterium]|nr:hypothetical protein [Bacteroidota bacterium]